MAVHSPSCRLAHLLCASRCRRDSSMLSEHFPITNEKEGLESRAATIVRASEREVHHNKPRATQHNTARARHVVAAVGLSARPTVVSIASLRSTRATPAVLRDIHNVDSERYTYLGTYPIWILQFYHQLTI
eukprot:6208951-Pleurochrysis_carterae.AAC.3